MYNNTANATSWIWRARPIPTRIPEHRRLRQHPEQPGHGLRRLQAQELERGRFVLRELRRNPHVQRRLLLRRASPTTFCAPTTAAYVTMYWGQSYTPVTNTTACDAIIAANKAQFGKSDCQRTLRLLHRRHRRRQHRRQQPDRPGALLPGWLAGQPPSDPEPGRPLRQGNPAPLRSHPLPLREVRMGRQDRSPHRRRLRSAAQRQGQGLRQLRPVLRHHEDGSGARFLRQRLLAQLRVRHGRSGLHQDHSQSTRSAAAARPPVRRRASPSAASSRTWTSAPPRRILAIRPSQPNMKPMKQHEFVTGVDGRSAPTGA